MPLAMPSARPFSTMPWLKLHICATSSSIGSLIAIANSSLRIAIFSSAFRSFDSKTSSIRNRLASSDSSAFPRQIMTTDIRS